MIRSILVGSDFDVNVIDYCRRRSSIEEELVRLINHEVTPKKEDLSIKEIDF